jgi:putative transposase
LRVVLPAASAPKERWSMDFMADQLADGRRFRILTVVDQFSRMSPLLEADFSLTGAKVAAALGRAAATHGLPRSITVDNGSEFFSKAMDTWAYRNGVRLDFIRPGKPIENAYIESFNGRLRDECLNAEIFFSVEDARRKLERWRIDYNRDRPHSSIGNLAPAEFERRSQKNRITKPKILNL